MPRRKQTSIRFGRAEKRLLREAANRAGEPWTRWVREAALNCAVDTLTEDRESEDREDQ